MNKYLLLISAIFVLVNQSHAFRFLAYGDSRSDTSKHQSIVKTMGAQNPELVIHTGDLWAPGYTAGEWKSHFTSTPGMNALLNANKILVSRGNHELESEVLNFFPPIVRSNAIEYSFLEGNIFFVSMGYDPGTNNSFLENELASNAAQNADWRIVFAHKPVYSTGKHGGNGIMSEGTNVENFRRICDQYNVDIFFSGHDHFYERTHLIYEGKIVSTGDDIGPDQQGTVYIVTGGGGALLYDIGSDWWVNTNYRVNHFIRCDATREKMDVSVIEDDGSIIDAFTLQHGYPVYDTIPPIITTLAPQSTVTSTSPLIEVRTNENAMVHWSYTDESFSDMDNFFSTADNKYHNTTLNNLKINSTYMIYLRAQDDSGNVSSSSTITFTVLDSNALATVNVRISNSTDDAEEHEQEGRMYLNSTDLELVNDGSNQHVGMRFLQVMIPQSAKIFDAVIQLTTDETGTAPTGLTIWGQASDDPPAFDSSAYDISKRTKTSTVVNWNPVAWNNAGEAGVNQKTPDLGPVIQELVNRDGWQPGNAMVFLIDGTGKRTAESWDGSSAAAPLLTIRYQEPPTSHKLFSMVGWKSTIGEAFEVSWDSPRHLVLSFSTNTRGKVLVTLHDLSGRQVARLYQGTKRCRINADLSKYRLAGGMYYLKFNQVGKKIMIAK